MKYDLFIRVALAEDLPERHLRRGDVATVVEHQLGRPGRRQVTPSKSSTPWVKPLMLSPCASHRSRG